MEDAVRLRWDKVFLIFMFHLYQGDQILENKFANCNHMTINYGSIAFYPPHIDHAAKHNCGREKNE